VTAKTHLCAESQRNGACRRSSFDPPLGPYDSWHSEHAGVHFISTRTRGVAVRTILVAAGVALAASPRLPLARRAWRRTAHVHATASCGPWPAGLPDASAPGPAGLAKAATGKHDHRNNSITGRHPCLGPSPSWCSDDTYTRCIPWKSNNVAIHRKKRWDSASQLPLEKEYTNGRKTRETPGESRPSQKGHCRRFPYHLECPFGNHDTGGGLQGSPGSPEVARRRHIKHKLCGL
jgi:hypothetical protein